MKKRNKIINSILEIVLYMNKEYKVKWISDNKFLFIDVYEDGYKEQIFINNLDGTLNLNLVSYIN